MSLKPSIYSIVTLTGRDGTSVDIRLACVSIDFYEDLLSPALSVKIQIANSGGAVSDGGSAVSLYDGLKVRGGELVQLRIEANSGTNIPIEFNTKPLFVRGVENLMRDSQKEFFTLELTTLDVYESETTFLVKRYPKEARISDHVQTIINESFSNPGNVEIDPTSNPTGFYGNQMHPFEALIRLASKSVPASSNGTGGSGGTAGFFFYQTKDGLKFRSIDALMQQQPKASYFYTEVNDSSCDFKPTTYLSSPDFRIIDFSIVRNNDMLEKLQKGTYSTQRRFFNPITQSVTSTEFDFTGDAYQTLAANLGEIFDPGQISLVGTNVNFTDIPTKVLTEQIDVGTTDIGVEFDIDLDPAVISSQRLMRYNTLFTQVVSVLVPLNSTLEAGDVIRCDLPKIGGPKNNDIDTRQTGGQYLIKEVNHHFDSRGSWTSMKLIRDTFGLK